MAVSNDLSIIIPCKNEEKYIGDLLQSIYEQDLAGIHELPIYIADADSTDKTNEIVSEWSDKLNLKIVKGGLPATGRNNGAKQAKTRYILFLDADITLNKNLIRLSLEMIEKNDLWLVSSLIKTSSNNAEDAIFWKMYNLLVKFRFLIGSFAAGMFMLFERQKFLDLGGFNENVEVFHDLEISRKIPLKKLGIVNGYYYANSRRFEKSGYFETLFLYLKALLHKKTLNRTYKGYW